ncbi:MAG TPA: response regulator [Elusimicrobiota bacterium]|jgi:CheY-like chemotaxis protein|nr:response regulator [Elusimicrobiota bacterium]
MASQVIVVDDDPIVGSLTLELLKDAGFEARLIQDSLKAQDAIKREQPALVVLDILMPGIDGLTLLHRLKSDPETAQIRAIVVSGKSFEAEKTRARQYGAELFIEKPYDVDSFGTQVAAIMKTQGVEPVKIARPPSAPAPEPRAELKTVVWGCRSASSAVSPLVTRYGKHTACVSIELPRHMIVFDAGSGISLLGNELMSGGRFKELWLFLSSFQKDHVEGLAGFPCARDASYTLNISGSGEPEKPLEKMLADAFEPGFGGEAPPCRIELYELIEQTYEILPGVRLTAFYANHPGSTLGYVLQTEERKIVYCPDSEVYGEAATALQDYDEKLGGLARGADLLIHDGRYTDEDYKTHRNTGHSSFLAAVDFAGRNAIKQLILVHQDDSYADDVLDKMAKDADARVAERGYAMKVALGREGLRFSI